MGRAQPKKLRNSQRTSGWWAPRRPLAPRSHAPNTQRVFPTACAVTSVPLGHPDYGRQYLDRQCRQLLRDMTYLPSLGRLRQGVVPDLGKGPNIRTCPMIQSVATGRWYYRAPEHMAIGLQPHHHNNYLVIALMARRPPYENPLTSKQVKNTDEAETQLVDAIQQWRDLDKTVEQQIEEEHEAFSAAALLGEQAQLDEWKRQQRDNHIIAKNRAKRFAGNALREALKDDHDARRRRRQRKRRPDLYHQHTKLWRYSAECREHVQGFVYAWALMTGYATDHRKGRVPLLEHGQEVELARWRMPAMQYVDSDGLVRKCDDNGYEILKAVGVKGETPPRPPSTLGARPDSELLARQWDRALAHWHKQLAYVPKVTEFRLQRVHVGANGKETPAYYIDQMWELDITFEAVRKIAERFPPWWEQVVAMYQQAEEANQALAEHYDVPVEEIEHQYHWQQLFKRPRDIYDWSIRKYGTTTEARNRIRLIRAQKGSKEICDHGLQSLVEQTYLMYPRLEGVLHESRQRHWNRTTSALLHPQVIEAAFSPVAPKRLHDQDVVRRRGTQLPGLADKLPLLARLTERPKAARVLKRFLVACIAALAVHTRRLERSRAAFARSRMERPRSLLLHHVRHSRAPPR